MLIPWLKLTCPILLIIMVGYIAAYTKLLSHGLAHKLSLFVFYLVLPVLLFFNIAKAPVASVLNWPYILSYLVVALILFTSTGLVSRYGFKRKSPDIIINIMACSHTNTAFLAVPLFLLLFNTSVPVASIILLQIVFALGFLIGLELCTHQHHQRNQWLALPLIVIKNPIILATLLGFLFSAFVVEMPEFIDQGFSLVSPWASGLALVALGISLNKRHGHIPRNHIEIGYLVLMKSVVHPMLGWLVGKYFFGLEPFWLQALVLICAIPTAQNVFIFSQRYKVGIERSNIIIIFTTLISFVTINVVLWCFG